MKLWEKAAERQTWTFSSSLQKCLPGFGKKTQLGVPVKHHKPLDEIPHLGTISHMPYLWVDSQGKKWLKPCTGFPPPPVGISPPVVLAESLPLVKEFGLYIDWLAAWLGSNYQRVQIPLSLWGLSFLPLFRRNVYLSLAHGVPLRMIPNTLVWAPTSPTVVSESWLISNSSRIMHLVGRCFFPFKGIVVKVQNYPKKMKHKKKKCWKSPTIQSIGQCVLSSQVMLISRNLERRSSSVSMRLAKSCPICSWKALPVFFFLRFLPSAKQSATTHTINRWP